MNWHDTILSIRQNPAYKDLVRLAYFDQDLELNVDRFQKSEEFAETLAILRQQAPGARSILDIGAGNGISAVNLALKGYQVTVVEPDPSDTVGANAIRTLQERFGLKDMTVYEKFAEEIGFPEGSFDVVYVRQAMHHAYDLTKFVSECARVLKPGGILLTVRDHVIYNPEDKQWFLEKHPLHKFYGGENAFTSEEYKNAMYTAGLEIVKELKFFDTPINYFPISSEDLNLYRTDKAKYYRTALRKKIGPLAGIPGLASIYRMKRGPMLFDEKDVPGRMYSYICRKA